MSKGLYPKQRKSGITIATLVVLLALLLFPVLAILRLAWRFDIRLAFGYAVFLSTVTYFLYGHDKKRAQSGGWRTPESTLHFIEFFGGWPGAFLAQRAFRHKVSKTSYQVVFWMIVIFHEFVAFDFVQDWYYLRSAVLLFR